MQHWFWDSCMEDAWGQAPLSILSPKHVLRSSLPLLQIEQQQQTSGYFHTLKGRRAALVVAVGECTNMGLHLLTHFE